MTAKGHVLLTMTLSYPLVAYFIDKNIISHEMIVLFFTIALFGALLPDIDEPSSHIGRKYPILAWTLRLFGLQHRGITHFLLLPLLISGLALLFIQSQVFLIALLSLSFGILAHDIGDLLTKGGIKGFFWPFFPNTNITLLPNFLAFKTFSITEYLIIFGLFVLNVFLYLGFFIKGGSL